MSLNNSTENSKESEERTKMASYAGSTPTTRLRPNPKHFLTWSATVANNRIQKLGKNFVNNVSRLHSKMERVMPTFHSSQEASTSPHNCSDQVENDLSEPNKDLHHHPNQTHESCRISRAHKIPLSASQNNCEKAECTTGSYLNNGAGLNCSSVVVTDEEDANEERYSGFAPTAQSYRALLDKSIRSNDDNNSHKTTCGTSAVVTSPLVYAGGNSSQANSSSHLQNGGRGVVELGGNNGISSVTTTTGPGFPHHIQVQSARIVQSHPFKQDVVPSSASSAVTQKSLVQSGHYKIPPNPTITAEALKAMIINSPTELNSCRKYDDKPQPIKCVDVEVETTNLDEKNMLELRTLPHENQLKYNLSCGSSGTSNSNNASMSDSSTSPLRMNAPLPISSPQWSRTSSLSTCTSSNAHNTQIQPVSILKGSLSNVENDCDKRINNGIGRRPLNFNSSTNIDEISSQGIDNEGLTLTDQRPTVSFSSPVIESSDKASLLINGKKLFTKKGKSNKNIQGGTRNNNNHNDKRSVAFQNPLSGTTVSSNRKHASVVSPEAYPPSPLTVTIFEEEAELRHAPWFQAGIPRDIALEVLRNEPIGSFIVRESTTKAGCFALSLRVPKEFKRLGIAHYLILKSGRGYKIKGFTKEFKSLNSLITHHSVMPELLPCPLSLHRYRPNYPQKISRFDSNDFMEPEKLVGFTNFVNCLESN